MQMVSHTILSCSYTHLHRRCERQFKHTTLSILYPCNSNLYEGYDLGYIGVNTFLVFLVSHYVLHLLSSHLHPIIGGVKVFKIHM